jgi:hypothetical protein
MLMRGKISKGKVNVKFPGIKMPDGKPKEIR